VRAIYRQDWYERGVLTAAPAQGLGGGVTDSPNSSTTLPLRTNFTVQQIWPWPDTQAFCVGRQAASRSARHR